jgi:hypothetical protein
LKARRGNVRRSEERRGEERRGLGGEMNQRRGEKTGDGEQRKRSREHETLGARFFVFGSYELL